MDEAAATPEFEEYLHREFPSQLAEWNDPEGRRGFLKLMAASLALAGVAVVLTRRPRLAGYAAIAVTAYVGGAVYYTVRRDDPYPNGAWLGYIEWLHPIGLAVVALAVIAAVGAADEADPPPQHNE